MSKATTISAKYIFLDIVGFTTRSVEAQADLVKVLNGVVSSSVAQLDIPREDLIFIPTGDGICVTLLSGKFDAHITSALNIMRAVQEHNSRATDDSRKFQVRVGINSNTDNLITDINGNRNVAGAGINMAARIMDLADGNQILVGESVFDTLRDREDYGKQSFQRFQTRVKHGREITVYQLVRDGHDGLNTNIPRAFQVDEPKEPNLSKTVAYYFAHAIRHQRSLLAKLEQGEATTGIVTLWFLAVSAYRRSYDRPTRTIHAVGDDFVEEQFDHYDSVDKDVRRLLSELICNEYLLQYGSNFEPTRPLNYLLVNKNGQRKLAAEWRNIWDEFELYRYI